MLQWVLESVLASDVHEVICVVRDLGTIRQQVSLVDDRLCWLVNYAADRGQSTSVIAGLWAIDPESNGVLFLVGDQPMMRSELIDSMIDRFDHSPAWIVAPTFKGQTRNPVLFRRNLFPELLQLTGEYGGRMLIEKNRDRTALLEWDDEVPFMDLDVREDYERLKRLA